MTNDPSEDSPKAMSRFPKTDECCFNLFTQSFARSITTHLPVGMFFEAWILVCEKFSRLQMVSREALHSSTTRALVSHLEQGMHRSSRLTLSEKVPYTNVERKYTLITCIFLPRKSSSISSLIRNFSDSCYLLPLPQDIFGP